MANYDGSSSLDMACDEFREHECGPCSGTRRTKEAKHYCIDCPDYLCDNCKDYHGHLAGTRNHNIVSGSRIPVFVSKGHGLNITCTCNKGQLIAFYCNDHQETICGACKTFNHHKCKTSSIKEKSSSYTSSKLNSVLAEIKSLEVKYERLKQESHSNKKVINQLKDACKKEITKYRKELDTIFDNLERNQLTELDEWKQDKDRRVDQDMTTIAEALNVLKVDCKSLEDAKRDGKKEAMFIADVQVSRSIQGYTRKLGELQKDIEKPTLAFERNEILADLAAGIDTLGSLISQRKGDKQDSMLPGKSYGKGSTRMLVDRKIKSRSEVNVRTHEDEDDPWITGCAVMPNGHVVLCDRDNNQIKLLDDSWTITGRLTLQRPWDISVIDSSHVIVSSPDNRQLQHVQVFPRMKAGRSIHLNKECWGVAVSGEKMYVSCHINPGDGEVRVLDLQGNIKRRLGINQDGSYQFTSPGYITVSDSGEKIFVSDSGIDIITCLTPSGTVIYTYKDDDMKCNWGLICDSGDNVLVCGWYSNNVHTISPDGNKYRTLLTSKDGLSYPNSIAYKESENSLIVDCAESNKLLLFKLA